MVVHRIPAIAVLLVAVVTSAAAQTSNEPAMPDGNAQRSRVLATKSVDAPPQQLLWQSEKLFQMKGSTPFSAPLGGPGGPMVHGELPTNYSYTFPVVSDGIVFFTIDVDNAYFYALDANTGKQIITLKFDKNRLSAPSAIGKVAYFATSSGKVYAYDVTARSVKWVYEGTGGFSGSSPAIEDGVVFVSGSRDGIVALAADTGDVKWTYRADQILTRPVVKGDSVVAYGVEGLLVAVDKATGKKKWETKLGRKFNSPGILDDQVVIRHVDGEIRAYALADGALRWKSNKSGGTDTGLALFKDLVIYGEEFGNIVALDARSGESKWKFKTSKPCLSPVVAGETIYTSCADRHLYAIDPANGELKWKFDGKKNGPVPTFYNGVMYFLASDGILQAVK